MNCFEDAFDDAWNDAKTPLERMYDNMMGDAWREVPITEHKLVDRASIPVLCRICERDNRWIKENDRVYVCEHEPIIGAGLCCRQIDSVKIKDVVCVGVNVKFRLPH